MSDDLASHLNLITKAIVDGRVVPFLGAGVNLCGRPADATWTSQARGYLPSGGELATHLASSFGYPAEEPRDLARVSQYVSVMTGSGPLYEELHQLLDGDYPATRLHELLTSLPGRLRAHGSKSPHQLIVTTNYDDVLERAFRAAGEPLDVVSYIAEGEQRGRFMHLTAEGGEHLVERPNEYLGPSLDDRSVLLKIHGAVDRRNAERDSYVITEDHYIDYLTRTEIASLVPVRLAAKLPKCHFLFLGYGLRDWNLRVILHRIWGAQKLKYKSWAIQLDAQPLDREFWRKRDVEIIDVALEQYVARLDASLPARVAASGSP